MKLRSLTGTVILLVASVPVAAESPCTRGAHNKVTDDFFFSISTDQGAVGDVVPVELSLTMTGSRDRLVGLSCVASYDPSILELLPHPEVTPVFDELAYISNFVTLGDRPVGPQSPSGRIGFYLGADFLRAPADTP